MTNLEMKIKDLMGEKETIISEMNEITKAFESRQKRLIEIIGSIKTLQELIEIEENTHEKEINN